MNSSGAGEELSCFTSKNGHFHYLFDLREFVFVFRKDDGYRLISEQVSHHPPISAFHAQSLKQEFEFHGSIYPKLKFWGKSVEAEPKGTMTLELLK